MEALSAGSFLPESIGPYIALMGIGFAISILGHLSGSRWLVAVGHFGWSDELLDHFERWRCVDDRRGGRYADGRFQRRRHAGLGRLEGSVEAVSARFT